MKVLVLEDTVSHQVRMETTLAELLRNLELTSRFRLQEKSKNSKNILKMETLTSFIFWILTLKERKQKGWK